MLPLALPKLLFLFSPKMELNCLILIDNEHRGVDPDLQFFALLCDLTVGRYEPVHLVYKSLQPSSEVLVEGKLQLEIKVREPWLVRH